MYTRLNWSPGSWDGAARVVLSSPYFHQLAFLAGFWRVLSLQESCPTLMKLSDLDSVEQKNPDKLDESADPTDTRYEAVSYHSA